MGIGGGIQILKHVPCFQINQLYSFFVSLLNVVHWHMNSSTHKHDSYTHKNTHTHGSKMILLTTFECDWNGRGMTSHPEVYHLLYYFDSMSCSPELTFWLGSNFFIPDGCLSLWSISLNPLIGKICCSVTFHFFSLFLPINMMKIQS